VKRTVTSFRLDAEQHWVAVLDCGHGRHVRHDPPLVEREWVLDEAQRDAKRGSSLDCKRCDRRELPEACIELRRTRVFTEATLPDALRSRHSTRRGVWGVLHVRSGRLLYRQHAPFDEEHVLAGGETDVIVPEVEHEVEPQGAVEFEIAFHTVRAAD
jgi:tellurite resistance-related uncharacterized protein